MRLAGRVTWRRRIYGAGQEENSIPVSSLRAEGSAEQESSFPLAAGPANPLKTMGQQRRGLARPLQAFSPDSRLGLVSLRWFLSSKRGQAPFVRSTRRAVPANGACPLLTTGVRTGRFPRRAGQGPPPRANRRPWLFSDRAGTRRLGWESPTHGSGLSSTTFRKAFGRLIHCRANDATRRDGNRQVVQSSSSGGRDEAQRLATGDRRQRTAPVSPREAAASRVLSWFSR
jgi:hypothetical protein